MARHHIAAILLLQTVGVICLQYSPDWPSIDSRPIPQWYKDAKLGIFLHWSVFSATETGAPGFEWKLAMGAEMEVEYMRQGYKPNTAYAELCHLFTAQYFNATYWIELFEQAGAK